MTTDEGGTVQRHESLCPLIVNPECSLGGPHYLCGCPCQCGLIRRARDAVLVDALAAAETYITDTIARGFCPTEAGVRKAFAALRATPPEAACAGPWHESGRHAECPQCNYATTPPEAGAELAVGEVVEVIANGHRGRVIEDNLRPDLPRRMVRITPGYSTSSRSFYADELRRITAPSPLAGPDETGEPQ